jgi:hypothetical protein
MRTRIGCGALAAMCALSLAAPAAAGRFAPTRAIKTAAADDVVKVEAVRRKHLRRAYVDVPVQPRAPMAAPGCPALEPRQPRPWLLRSRLRLPRQRQRLRHR